MRFFLPVLLLTVLTGCTAGTSEPAPEQTSSTSAESSETIDPMASETVDPMASETVDPMESEDAASTASPAPTTAKPTQSPTPTQTASSYTLAEVAKRNTPSECWVAIDGEVYDLTGWISEHPGGSGAIRSLCGTDGTDEFSSQHGGEGRPASTLDSYYLGPLAG